MANHSSWWRRYCVDIPRCILFYVLVWWRLMSEELNSKILPSISNSQPPLLVFAIETLFRLPQIKFSQKENEITNIFRHRHWEWIQKEWGIWKWNKHR